MFWVKFRLPILWAILAFAFLTRIYRVNLPSAYYFDEVYHGATAKLISRNDPSAYEWTATAIEPDTAIDWLHPPLAKYTQAIFILIFGENSFGWRISSVIFGVGVIYLTYLLARELFASERLSLLSAFLASLDGLLLTQSRIAMNDIQVTFFILLTLLAYFKYLKNKNLNFLFFTGLSAGLAMGTKWSGVFGLLVVWLFEGLGMITALNEYRIKHSYIHVFMLGLKQLSARVLLLGMLPLVVYVASYSQMFLQGKSWSHFIELHQQIINYQTHLEATHYYQSRPLQWFFNLKSVWYYVEFGVGQRADIYALGNSMLFWFGDLAVIASLISVILNLSQRDPLCGFQDLKNKKILKRVQNDTLLFLLISYFTVWLPWVFSPRIMFFYHYTPAVPLLTIILAYWLTKLFGLKPKTKNQKLKRFGLVTQSLSYSVTWLSENSRQEFFVKLIISLIVLNFVVFYPHWTGIATPVWLKDNLYFLLPGWK